MYYYIDNNNELYNFCKHHPTTEFAKKYLKCNIYEKCTYVAFNENKVTTFCKCPNDYAQASLGELVYLIGGLIQYPELFILMLTIGEKPNTSKLDEDTVLYTGNAHYVTNIFKYLNTINNHFESKNLSWSSDCKTDSHLFIRKYEKGTYLTAWKSIEHIENSKPKSAFISDKRMFSIIASYFRKDQTVYNLLYNLSNYFRMEYLTPLELNKLLHKFKDYQNGNTNQLQEERTDFSNGCHAGECRSYGQGSKVAVRFGYLSNRARIVASTSNCYIITTEISTKCSRNS